MQCQFNWVKLHVIPYMVKENTLSLLCLSGTKTIFFMVTNDSGDISSSSILYEILKYGITGKILSDMEYYINYFFLP